MLLSAPKSWEEISGYLEGEKNIFILGCRGCAESSGSGGPAQVEEMRERLTSNGKNVTGAMVIDFLCQKALVKSKLRPREADLKASDSLLVMTCGVGVQAVAASVNKTCHPACNTVNLGGSRGEWMGSERCFECGECLLDYTGGICPLTACTKSLLNGACGGASEGKCELAPEKDCGWELIYQRLKSRGRLGKLKEFIRPKDYSRLEPNPQILATSIWALEQSGQKEEAK